MRENFFIKTVFISIASILIFAFASIFFQNCRSSNRQRVFISSIPYERQKWLSSDIISSAGNRSNFRPGIARGLIEQNTLVGKSREEIIEMLGKSENHGDSESKIITYKLEEIYYIIDPIAFEDLVITFNNNDKVEKAEIQFHKIGHY